MSFRTSLLSLISSFTRRSRIDLEMDEELRSHIASRSDDLERSGIPRFEAERRARVEFGGYEHFKEECRETSGGHFFETLRQDVFFAFRLLRKSPAFTLVAIITLGLGIGANTAIFRVVYSVLLRPLPFAHAEELVVAFENKLSQGVKQTGCSYQDLLALRESGIFNGVAGIQRHDLTLTGSGDPTVVTTVVVT